jgi:hypothetical protein
MSQRPLSASNIVAPQTGTQLISEIVSSQPTSANIAAAINSTAFTYFQCNFAGSVRGVLLSWGANDNTINVTECSVRRSVLPLPLTGATLSQINAEAGVAQIFANPGTLNPIFNSGPIDFSNAYQQGELPIFPGDVLFVSWLRAVAGTGVVNCGATWRFGRDLSRMF